MKIKSIIICSIAVTLLVSCGKKSSISIAGSTTVLPVISNAADIYKEQNKEVTILVNAGGSGVGVNQLGEGKVDIGMISRDLTTEEIEKYSDISFNTIAIGKDAVVPVVSSEIYNAGITALSLADIARIYKGEITNWQSVGGPDREILCVDKESSRGTRHVFMEIVMGNKEAEAPGADLVLGSNNEEQTAIVQSDAAIGMLSNAWLSEDVIGLGIILENGEIIAPTITNIVSGKFPITRDLLILTNGKPEGEIKKFIDFVLSKEGQELVEEAGYVKIQN